MRIVKQNSKRDSEGSKFVAKKSGSGGIRTHDKGLMSPLLYP